jgi:cysteinyl-tRNA synthetase
MSKSLGNFFTIRDVLEEHDGEVIRFFILRSHYRSPLNYTADSLADAREGLLRLYNALSADFDAPVRVADIDWTEPRAARFADAMNDDFNTVVAIAVLFELASALNRTRDPRDELLLRQLGAVIGLLGQSQEEVRRSGLRGRKALAQAAQALDDAGIEAMIARRTEAKKARRYADADAIRAELAAQGIVLEDTPAGTTWRR